MRKHKARLILAVALLAVFSHSAFGAAAKLHKSITPLDSGEFLIKLKVTATSSSIYALRLVDAKSAIVNVYAPRGWCMVTDGEDLLARTSGAPIKAGKTLEFIIHTTSEEVQYTWTVFGKIKQLGESGSL
jgi:hypothetical protein